LTRPDVFDKPKRTSGLALACHAAASGDGQATKPATPSVRAFRYPQRRPHGGDQPLPPLPPMPAPPEPTAPPPPTPKPSPMPTPNPAPTATKPIRQLDLAEMFIHEAMRDSAVLAVEFLDGFELAPAGRQRSASIASSCGATMGQKLSRSSTRFALCADLDTNERSYEIKFLK